MESGITFDRLITGYALTQIVTSTIHLSNHQLYYPQQSYWDFLFDELVISLSIGYGFIFALLCAGIYHIKQENKNLIYRECKDELIDSTSNNGCDCSSCEQSDDDSDADTNTNTNSNEGSSGQQESLSSRMKRYEAESSTKSVIECCDTFVIRLDGRCFSKFTTKYFNKPFDKNSATIMLNTANALFKEFHPAFIHVQSDEISLVFKNMCTKEENENEPGKYKHIFGGKVNKMISVVSSYASSTFCRNLMKFLNTADESYTELKTNDIDVCFIARISVIPQDYEIVNYTYWRSVIDGYCNTALLFARNMFNIHDLNNMSPNKMIEKMKTNNFDFTKQPNHVKYGWIIKNSQIMSLGEEKTNENSEDAYRYIPQACSFRIKYSTELKELLLDPVWNDEYLETLDVETESF
jgi:tRNA(His) 5'-end guanylyltransferase